MESLGMAIEVFDGYVSNRARNPRAAQKSAVVPLSIIDETAAAGRPPIRWRHRFPGWSHGLNGSRMADPEKKRNSPAGRRATLNSVTVWRTWWPSLEAGPERSGDIPARRGE